MAKSYFSFFKKVVIDEIEITDIFDNISIKQIFHDKTDLEIFDRIQFDTDDSVEDIAYKLYEDRQYWWIITSSNQSKDFLYDFPLQEIELRSWHAKEMIRLNTENLGQTGYPLTLAAENTFWEQMFDDNEAKRDIKVLKKKHLGEFLAAVKKLKGVK